MLLKDYLQTIPPGERAGFAERCGTTEGHLRNVSYGYRTCAESLAIAIERESGGQIRVEDLRPDVDWAVIRGSAAPAQAA